MHVAGEVTAYGCDADPQPRPADSEVVARLRAAGAVIIGKTHVPELMATPFTESPTFGVTRNPWDVHRTRGRLQRRLGDRGRRRASRAPRSGSDGAGSIRIPAACAALFGLKPQRGRVSTAPEQRPAPRAWPSSARSTRTVEDAALIMRRDRRRRTVARRGGRDRARAGCGSRSPPALPPLGVKPDAEQLGAVRLDRGASCASSATRCTCASFDWGMTHGQPRSSRASCAAWATWPPSSATRDRLSRRARGIARIGHAIPARVADAAAAQAAADAEQLNAIFDASRRRAHADVHPPAAARARVRRRVRRPRTLVGNVRFAPYAGAFNHTGQPAVARARRLHERRLPDRRPARRPARLRAAAALAVRAAASGARDWAAHRPAVAA